MPRALFINSTIALEGVVRFLKTLPADELAHCAFGCYDWDPFASVLSFPLMMVRQDVEGLLGEAFRIIDSGSFADRRIIEIKPELVFMQDDRGPGAGARAALRGHATPARREARAPAAPRRTKTVPEKA